MLSLQHRSRFLLLAAIAALTAPASAQTISAADRGSYLSFGVHNASNLSYFVGNGGGAVARNFFLFALPATVPGQQYVSATLRLVNPAVGFVSPDLTETYSLRAYSGSLANLVADNGNGNGSAVFADLGDGTDYGSHVASEADNGNTVEIPLSAAAVADINGAAGGQFAFGGLITSLDANPINSEGIFSNTTSLPADAVQLVLTQAPVGGAAVVPEPASLALFGAAGLGALALRRRRRRIPLCERRDA